MNETERRLLRHVLATLAYRTQRALRDAPEDFANFTPGAGVRTPHHLLSHMSDVLSFARARAEDISYPLPNTDTFEEEQTRFFSILESLSDCLKRGVEFRDTDAERLLQGPLADAMTHSGQLAVFRRLCQSPIPPESFHEAAIKTDNASQNQPEVKATKTWLEIERPPLEDQSDSHHE